MNVRDLIVQLTPIVMQIGPKNGAIIPVQVIISNRSYALESVELKNGYLVLNHGKVTTKLSEFYSKLKDIYDHLKLSGSDDTYIVSSGPINREVTKVNYTNNVIQLIV